jgi:hypothetical protein
MRDFGFEAQGNFLIYNLDAASNEVFQMVLYDIAKRSGAPITDEKSKSTELFGQIPARG